MINLYGAKEQDMTFLEKNGDIVITPMKAVLHKYENGDYYIDLEVSTDYLEYITQDRIIKADMPWNDYEIFRINNISVDHNRIKCKCWHISYDLKYYAYTIDTPYPLNFDVGGYSVNQEFYSLFSPTRPQVSWRTLTSSNSEERDRNNFVIVNQYQSFPVPRDYKLYPRLKTMYDMIEEIRKVYNAYTYRKKLEVYLLPTRTTYDSEITIEYGKNLKELTKTENWDNFAGIIDTLIPQPNNWDKSKEYTCPDAYFFPPQGLTKKDCHKTVSFQSIISADDYNNVSDYVAAITAEQEQQALEYFQKYAKPIVSYNFKGNIDGNVDLGAIILVRDLQIGANIETVVIGFQYDLISKKYVEVSFGNSAESIKGYNNRIDDKLKISEKNSPLLTYPVGSIYVNSGASPNMGGFWELQSSSGGLYTWKRTA